MLPPPHRPDAEVYRDMYEAFYNLSADPFRLLPDAAVSYPHRSCARAWAFIRYALRRGEGIVVVTGQPGSGKTSLAERLLTEVNPAKTVAVRLVADGLDATELLRRLAYGLGLPVDGTDRARMSYIIERHLMELELSQRNVLVVIDEAQAMSHQALEAMRLLTDLQSRSRPVLQLFLFGHESLEEVMQVAGMEQFQQRVVAGCRLQSMTLSETKAYMEHRLSLAGWRGIPAVSGPAVVAIHRHSLGWPRHVNKICGRLLLHGCIEERRELGEADVLAVVGDLHNELLTPLGHGRQPGTVLDVTHEGFLSTEELALESRSMVPSRPVEAAGEQLGGLFVGDEESVQPSSQPAKRAARKRFDSRPVRARAASGRRRTSVVGRTRWAIRRRSQSVMHYFSGLVRGLSRLFNAPVALLTRSLPGLRHLMSRSSQSLEALLEKTGIPGIERMAPAAVPLMLAVPLAVTVGTVWLGFGSDSATTGRPASFGSQGEASFIGFLNGASVFDVGQGYMDSSTGMVWAGASGAQKTFARVSSPSSGAVAGQSVSLMEETSSIDPAQLRQVGGETEDILLSVLSGNSAQGLMGALARSGKTLDIWLLAQVAGSNSDRMKLSSSAIAAASDAVEHESAAVDGAKIEEEEQQVALIVDRIEHRGAGYVQVLPATGAGVTRRAGSVKSGARDDSADVDLAQAANVSNRNAAEMSADAAPARVQLVSMAVKSTQAEQPTVGTAVDGKISVLLKMAEEAFVSDRLTIPNDKSALTYYRRVLALDQGNTTAILGIDRIVERYAGLGETALSEGLFDKAERYAKRALRIEPGAPKMKALLQKIDDARNERAQQIALAEMAAIRAADEARAEAETLRRLEQARRAKAAEKPARNGGFWSLIGGAD